MPGRRTTWKLDIGYWTLDIRHSHYFCIMAKLEEQLKAAITRMPVAEKDKLLLRLVAKDEKLVRRLIFELMEGGETRDERASALREEIAADLAKAGKDYLTPGYLLMYLRHWNARINEHVQATKDKAGDVILVLFMLAEAIRLHEEMLRNFPDRRSDTLAPYLVKRMQSIHKKAEKLHEDYHMDFREDAQTIMRFIWSFKPTAQLAKELGLPGYWPL